MAADISQTTTTRPMPWCCEAVKEGVAVEAPLEVEATVKLKCEGKIMAAEAEK
jgi:hypothetical protein